MLKLRNHELWKRGTRGLRRRGRAECWQGRELMLADDSRIHQCGTEQICEWVSWRRPQREKDLLKSGFPDGISWKSWGGPGPFEEARTYVSKLSQVKGRWMDVALLLLMKRKMDGEILEGVTHR
ncbi:hypothetical protein VTL71DRAFT_12076 [Oculimacula yallundae]|uniref:Uncharacterized protein n=1 Tax=Oculimacula yallundae TaxID=86028 RepID=A0ABR4CSI7_9HELO